MIPDVLAYASRETTMDRRRTFAAFIRGIVREPGIGCEQRVQLAADDLEALASELEDEALSLEPAAAAACLRLLTDPALSPLINPVLPPEDLRSRVFQIRGELSPAADRRHERKSLCRPDFPASSGMMPVRMRLRAAAATMLASWSSLAMWWTHCRASARSCSTTSARFAAVWGR